MIQGEAPLPGLESAEHRDVDVGPVTHLLQGQALLRSEFSQPAANASVDPFVTVWVCLHGN